MLIIKSPNQRMDKKLTIKIQLSSTSLIKFIVSQIFVVLYLYNIKPF